MYRSAILLVILSLFISVSAQEGDIRFRHLMDRHDLSSNSVMAVCQDHRGFMWFGTRDGLNRYDGYEFRTYHHVSGDSTSLVDNHVNVIFEDSRNRLWIGTANGLDCYDRERDFFTHFPDGDDQLSFSSPYVWTICEDTSGMLWIGTSSGMNVFDPASGTFTHYFAIPQLNGSNSMHVHKIFSDSKGRLWLGTRSGLFRFNQGLMEHVPLNPAAAGRPLWVRDILEDRQGKLWIATEQDGVFQVNPEDGTIMNLFNQSGRVSVINNRVRTLHEAPDGKIWMGTREGLSVYDPEKGHLQHIVHDKYNPSSLTHNSVRDIASDHLGGIWIATYAGGINYYHASQNIFHLVREQLGSDNTLVYNRISCLYKDSEGLLWIGTEGRGLSMLDEKQGRFRHYYNHQAKGERQVVINNIKSITEAANGDFWIGTNGGLVLFDKRQGTFTNFNHDPDDSTSLSFDQVHSTMIDREGNLWVGTNGGGLDRYVPGYGFVHHRQSDQANSLLHNSINVLLQDAAGKIWIGTQAGLDCLDPETGRFQAYKQNPEETYILHHHRVLALYEDAPGNLWIGTDGLGMQMYDPRAHALHRITKEDGLPNNVVNAIIQDDYANFWISTNRGITRLTFNDDLGDREREIRIRNFGTADGLQALQFYPRSALKDANGRIYFGGIRGYNYFSPEQLTDDRYTPAVVFTDFKLGYASVSPGEEGSPLTGSISETDRIRLDYKQKDFSLTFAGLHYLNPENLYYSYKLVGLDPHWNDLGNQRTLTFAYLKPGEYELRIRASDDPNNWAESHSSLIIQVMPPWWRTWWAYLIYLAAATGILSGIWLYTRRWYRLKSKLALEHLNWEKEQEIHQLKSRFFTDISHELRTPLTLILAPVEKLISGLKDNFRLTNQLVMIQRNGMKMLGLINQLLDLRKFETGHMELQAARGNISKFVRETTLSFRELARVKGILFEYSSADEKITAWFDRAKLEMVLFNLLSNAFKATKSGDSIVVELSRIKRDSKKFIAMGVRSDLPPESQEFIQIAISDCGKGIPGEKLEQLFDRFHQITDPQVTADTGTGVGLELTKRMVELHGGFIGVESRVATGEKPGMTVFTVLIPLGKEHLEPHQIDEDYRSSEDPALYQQELLNSELLIDQQKSNDKKIEDLLDTGSDKPELVVVEDNREVCSFIRDMFKNNFHVHTAYDGEQGWERILDVIPDIIISDVMMPGIDGIELCRLLKSDKRTSHIPVILLTARTAVTFKYEGLETGADDYIQKPFSAEYLHVRVRNLIRQRQLIHDHFVQRGSVEPKELPILSVDEKIMRKAIRFIEDHLSDPELSVESLSREIGLSRVHLYRKLKHLTNLSPVEFIRSIRLQKAARLLEQGKLTISEIRYLVGFQDAEYFRKSFRKQFGVNPREYAGQLPGD